MSRLAKHRIAVLGCGSIGRRHARNLQAAGYQDLLLFDPSAAARTQALLEAGGIEAGSLEELWELAPDIAFVTAPSADHVRLATACVEHGCHLFIEKPLSHDLEGVDELRLNAESRGLITMVGCNMRFHPGPEGVKRLLDAGTIGRVLAARIHTGSYLPRWRPWQDHRTSYSASVAAGGAILDCIHEIDLALWYLGPAKVVAALRLPGDSIEVETEALAEILLAHQSGAISSVHLNFLQRDYRRSCQIIGTEGTIAWDFSAQRIDVFGTEGVLDVSHSQPEGWEMNDMYVDELEHFMECVAYRRPTINPIGGGVAALEIAVAARAWEAVIPA